MKTTKPQHALVQTAPTQFGSAACMGISVGCGFRLSDPRVLLHEAQVWHAFPAAPLTTPIMETALPKRHAEWLLGGHARCVVDRPKIGSQVDWDASVVLEGVKKDVNCSARIEAWRRPGDDTLRGRASLAIDHRQASRDLQGRVNPVGVDGAGPLQLVGKLGPTPASLAAMGPIDAQWASRADLAPNRGSVLDPWGADGTHMGWPANTDFGYFQLAPSDQHHRRDAWSIGASYELHGFGGSGGGYRGNLPRLQPLVAVRRRDERDPCALELKLQTVWFLPDFDVGVLWFNGMLPLRTVLSDEIDWIAVALREPEDVLSPQRLGEIVNTRMTGELRDIASLRDSDLLPARSRGWTWDLVLGAEDHPSLREGTLSYEAQQSRVTEYEANLDEAAANVGKLRALQAEAADKLWDGFDALEASLVLPEVDWRRRIAASVEGVLSDALVMGAQLDALRVDGVRLVRVSFRNVDFSASIWRHCHFEDVEFSEVDLRRSRWEACSFVRCRFVRSDITETRFEQCGQRSGGMEQCRVGNVSYVGGSWEQMTLTDLQGEALEVRDTEWVGVSWLTCSIGRCVWSRLTIANSSLVECTFPYLAVCGCRVEKFSVVTTDLMHSEWRDCTGESISFVRQTDLGHARIEDCSFARSCWTDVTAVAIEVRHTSLVPLVAPRLCAPRSTWVNCILNDANLMHADLSSSVMDATSLKDANVYGADLRGSRITNCNLIRVLCATAHGAESLFEHGNLVARVQSTPWRRP